MNFKEKNSELQIDMQNLATNTNNIFGELKN